MVKVNGKSKEMDIEVSSSGDAYWSGSNYAIGHTVSSDLTNVYIACSPVGTGFVNNKTTGAFLNGLPLTGL